MKKLSIIMSAVMLCCSLSVLITGVSACGLNNISQNNIAFSSGKYTNDVSTSTNTNGSNDNNSNSNDSSLPSWVKELNATPTPEPTATRDPKATSDPDATPEPTEEPITTPSATPGLKYITAGTPEAEVVKVPILLYHHISTEFDKSNAISVISPKDFRLHMTAIKAQFTPISLREYAEFVQCKDGSKTIPNDPIIVTFDDGYLSNYEIAYPILKELEIPATIFIVTDTVGSKGGEGKVNYSHFTWEQAKEMQNSGIIDIQSHTNDHVKLGELASDKVNFQLRKSKYLIEKNIGNTCDMIAYPYGSYNDGAIGASGKTGYTTQCLVGDDASNIDYEVNMPRDGLNNLTRITVSGLMGNVNVIELVRQALSHKVN